MLRTEEKFREALTTSTGDTFRLVRRPDGTMNVRTPFCFPDGDCYVIGIEATDEGWRLSDRRSTIMQLGYYIDTSLLDKGATGRMFQRILQTSEVRDEKSYLMVEATDENLTQRIFELCAVITEVRNLEYFVRELEAERVPATG